MENRKQSDLLTMICTANRSYLHLFIFLLTTLLMSGGDVLAEAPGMVPYLDYSSFKPSSKTLRIAPTESQSDAYGKQGLLEKSFPRIEEKEFQDALIETIKKSNIFKVTRDNRNANYELRTLIVGHRVLPGVKATVILFVRYTLLSMDTQEVLWQENLLSQYEGYGRDIEYANNAAVRKILTELMNRLSRLSL